MKFLYLSRVMEITQIEKEEDESVSIHFGGHFLERFLMSLSWSTRERNFVLEVEKMVHSKQ